MSYQHHNAQNRWEIETPKEADECSFCDLEAKPEFVLTPKLMAVARRLCKEIEREWQIILKGEETETGIFAYDYYIPKQETGPASVKNMDEIDLERATKNKWIGTMHSHGEIGVSFSGTDDQCTNHSFLKHHIVTNNRGDYLAISRIVLPCGLIKFADARVIMKVPSIKKVKGIDNIEERTYKPIVWPPKNDNPTGGGIITYHEGSNEGITWKRGARRQHGFMYDQDREGGYCGF
jgi:hypothetical protein